MTAWRFPPIWLLLLGLASLAGCGTTKSNSATEQLLMSDAMDRSVASLNFRALAGQKVFLDTEYILRLKAPVPGQPASGFSSADYCISAVRQQMAGAGCLLQEKKEDADYIVEARVGALGTDSHEVIYGVPANNMLSAAAAFVPTAPSVPSIPEISLAKRNQQLAAAKIGVFAYDRVTREIVWQSGISDARSTAKATWIAGAGPFQRGEIYNGTQFAGAALQDQQDPLNKVGLTDYFQETHFVRLKPKSDASGEGDAAEQTANADAKGEPATAVHDANAKPLEPAAPIAEQPKPKTGDIQPASATK